MRRWVLAAICWLFTGCGESVDVATFNIRMFPEPSTDVQAVAGRLVELDASVIAVQEIRDRLAFEAMLAEASSRSGRDYRLVPGPCGGLGLEIITGVVYDAQRWELAASRGYPDLRRNGSCGPGLPGTLAVLDGHRKRLAVLSVHLHPFPDRFELRKQQWGRVLSIVEDVEEEFEADAVVAMGDYNSTGYTGAPAGEKAFIEQVVRDAGDELVTDDIACTEYWQPTGTQGPFEPSVLDHVVTRGGRWDEPEARGMCQRLDCESAEVGQMDPDFQTVSDHCPVTVHGKI